MNTKACYKKLHRYKYQLKEKFEYQTAFLGYSIDTKFIKVNEQGVLIIEEYYAWDGPSGPTKDTLNSMRGSLVHDALYQLLREEELSQELLIPIDKLFIEILKIDGMGKFRRWYWYRGLRLANGSAGKPGSIPDLKTICVP